MLRRAQHPAGRNSAPRLAVCVECALLLLGRMKYLSFACALVACSHPDAAPTPDAASGIGTTVTIDSGPLLGYSAGDLVVFKGIPYVAPPLGALRFAPPAPVTPWMLPRPALTDPPMCPQPGSSGVVGDEDCLTVNVWTHPDADHRPVLVFVHGGSGTTGNHYDSSHLADATGAVVVTVQYRLGALGNLALPELADGNFALLDQQAALHWVQRNISVFGGDPTRVLLFGESAGGFFTCAHTIAPESSGLYAAALSESGQCTNLPERALMFGKWQADVVTNVGCNAGDRIACLRAVSPAQLVTGNKQSIAGPVVDGTHVPLHAIDAWRTGAFAHVPLVVGSNRDEANLWLAAYAVSYWWLDGYVNSPSGYAFVVQTLFPAQSSLLLSMYPYASYGSGFAALDAMLTDIWLACPVRGWARAVAAGGGTVWQYEFTDSLQNGYAILGTPHALELAWVFGLWTTISYTPTAAQLDLSAYMQGVWNGLAATGTMPSEWPQYSLATDEHFELGPSRGARTGFRNGRCDALVNAGLVPPSL